MIDDEDNISPLESVPDRIDEDGTNHGISLGQVKKAYQETEASERAKYSGEPVLWDDTNIVNETVSALQPIEDAWTADVRERYNVASFDELRQRAEWDNEARAELQSAVGQYRAMAEGYAQIKQSQEDEKFNKLRPGDADTREELALEAWAYLRKQGLADGEIAQLWNSGALRRATNQVRLHDIVKGEANRKRELRALDRKFVDGEMTLREAARRSQLKGTAKK
jgi:hypothetical protein